MTAATESDRKALVRAFFADVLGAGRADGLEMVADDYRPELPALVGLPELAPGRDALRARLQKAGPVPHQIHRIVADGAFVYAHVRYDGAVPFAGADIFRFDENGRIAAHRSSRQAIPDDAAKGIDRFGGGGYADRATTPERRDTIRRVAHEVFDLWRRGNAAEVSRYYDDGYIQHNPDMPGGAQRIREVFDTDIKAYMAATGGPFPVDCHLVGVEGDLIFVNYSVSMVGIGRSGGARSTNTDIFRIDDNDRMAEHWDVLQIEGEPLPPAALLF